jgi:hypothetical protein
VLYAQHGSLNVIAKHLGVARNTIQRAYHKAVELGLMDPLEIGPKTHQTLKQRARSYRPRKVRHKAFILTCAQNNTHVHSGTWENLQALADFNDAKLLVSTFRYARRSLWQKNLDQSAYAECEHLSLNCGTIPRSPSTSARIAWRSPRVSCGAAN